MLSIGIGLKPAPDFNIEPEFFYAGQDIIGGVIKLTLSGTHYADSVTTYETMSDTILSLNGVCRTLQSLGTCGGTLGELVGSVGFIESASTSDTDSPLNLGYTIVMVFTHSSSGRTPFIEPSSAYTGMQGNLILTNYSQSESLDASSLSTFVFQSSGKLLATQGEYNVECSVGVYASDRCDSGGATNKKQNIKTFLDSQTGFDRNFKIPSGFTRFLINEKVSIGENGGSISKKYIIAPSNSVAVVTLNRSNRTDQITGIAQLNIQGNITGLRSFADAQTVYSKISNIDSVATQDLLSSTCGDNTPLPLDLCRILSSSKRIDNQAQRSIAFDFTYSNVEKCVAQGYQIVTEYSENKDVHKIAEYLIPGKIDSIVFKSAGKTARKMKLKVTGRITSCNEDFVSTVEGGVRTEFNTQKNDLGLLGGNVIRISEGEETGRYSFSKTEEYIECT